MSVADSTAPSGHGPIDHSFLLRPGYRGVDIGTAIGSRTAIGIPFCVKFRSASRWNSVVYCVWLCKCGDVSHIEIKAMLRNGSKCRLCASRERRVGVDHKRLHNVWRLMRYRCENEKANCFMRYGGRGISVCKEWVDSSGAFESWALQSGYRQGLQLDRIDNDGNYEPGNCRWVTGKQNSRNTKNNRVLEFNGKAMCISEWTEFLGMPHFMIASRLSRGWSVEDTLTKPHRIARLRTCKNNQ